jgi:HAD superfamily hydrolase (TIGR01490 family)
MIDSSPPSPGSQAAFFDIDNTLVRGAAAFHLLSALRRRGLVSGRALIVLALRNLRFKLVGERRGDIEATRSAALTIIKGLPVAEVLITGELVFDEVLSSRIFPGTQALFDSHRRLGHQIWFVSAGPIEIGQLMAERMGATGALGTVAERSGGYYTGRLIGDLLHGTAKADAVRRLAQQRSLDLAGSFAYSDSVNDLPLFETVGQPCGINPDRRLRLVCSKRAWPVHEFAERPTARRRSLRAAGRVGAIWAVIAVVRTLRRRRTSPLSHPKN